MQRKASWMGGLVMALLVTGMSAGVPCRLMNSAQSFERYFQELKGAGNSIGPLERVVFSLVLAGADQHRTESSNR